MDDYESAKWLRSTGVDRMAKSILLIVDDESSVCRALSRMLKRHFDRVITAVSPKEAEVILYSNSVTHVICDHWFGAGQPLGLDIAARWKEEFKSIKRAVVLTGTDATQLTPPPGVHQIMAKTAEAEDLASALGILTGG